MSGPLKNARHEKFAQNLAKGRSQAEAYMNAGYETGDAAASANAARLIGNDSVAARVAELQTRTAGKAEITLDSLLCEAAEIQLAAQAAAQFSAANGALKLKAELSGHYVQRKEDVTPRRSSDQIDSRVRQLLADRDKGRAAGASGRAGEGAERDEAIPTVPGHGTA